VLHELLARIGDSVDGVAYVSEKELAAWPRVAVKALQTAGLLRAASPAASATCDGCERRCFMPVEVLDSDGETAAFIFCDKPEEIGRIEVSLDRLRRWQASGSSVAAVVARMLGATPVSGGVTDEMKWPVGRLAGKRVTERIELDCKNGMRLEMAGHSVELAEVMRLTGKGLTLDRQTLIDCVNNPAARRGFQETPAKHAERIFKLSEEIGVKAAAVREGRSPSRIKQLRADHRRNMAAGKKM
jgi:hypothetical protein